MSAGVRGERGRKGTDVVIAPLNLRQCRLHTLQDRILNIEHIVRQRLIQLDDVRFALLEVRVDVFVEAASSSLVSVRGREEARREGSGPRDDEDFAEFELYEGGLERGETESEGFGAVREGFEEADLPMGESQEGFVRE